MKALLPCLAGSYLGLLLVGCALRESPSVLKGRLVRADSKTPLADCKIQLEVPGPRFSLAPTGHRQIAVGQTDNEGSFTMDVHDAREMKRALRRGELGMNISPMDSNVTKRAWQRENRWLKTYGWSFDFIHEYGWVRVERADQAMFLVPKQGSFSPSLRRERANGSAG
jgi:hypothetical protein